MPFLLYTVQIGFCWQKAQKFRRGGGGVVKLFLAQRAVVKKGMSMPSLGNVQPAGHMRPAKQLNVAREHFFRLIKHLKNVSI